MGKWFSLGGSMEPPLCTNGSVGYLMQLSVKAHKSTNLMQIPLLSQKTSNLTKIGCFTNRKFVCFVSCNYRLRWVNHWGKGNTTIFPWPSPNAGIDIIKAVRSWDSQFVQFNTNKFTLTTSNLIYINLIQIANKTLTFVFTTPLNIFLCRSWNNYVHM